MNYREAILKTYCIAPHAFERGCGKDTMMYWVAGTAGIYFPKKRLRREICKILTAIREKNRCTRFSRRT